MNIRFSNSPQLYNISFFSIIVMVTLYNTLTKMSNVTVFNVIVSNKNADVHY